MKSKRLRAASDSSIRSALRRKVAGQFIHQIRKLNCFLPDIEFLNVKHSAVISPSTLNYQPSTLGLFGANGIMLSSNHVADEIEQFRFVLMVHGG